MTNGNSADRPILAGGERLKGEVERPGGGGPKYHPQHYSDLRESLYGQARKVAEWAREVDSTLRAKRVVFRATLLPNYLAPSYFPSEVLEETGLRSVGSTMSHEAYTTKVTTQEEVSTKTLLFSGEDEHIDALVSLLSRTGDELLDGVVKNLIEFSRFEIPAVEDVLSREGLDVVRGEIVTWEAILHKIAGISGSDLHSQKEEVLGKLEALVLSLGGEVRFNHLKEVGGLDYVPILLPAEDIESVAQFNPLRRLRPMPRPRPIPTSILRSVQAPLPAPPNEDDTPESLLRIAVFDGGVEPDDPYLSPFVNHFDLSLEDPEHDYLTHGSMVNMVLLYGYHEEANPLPRPAVSVDHYRVLPVPLAEQQDRLELNWILDRIVEVVEKQDYDVVSLSIGPNVCVDDGAEPHRWTAELDRLARERGILFVVAAGNNGELDASTGTNRVQVPSDMVNGLTVGACNRRTPVRTWDRSPYSAVGPGRWGGRMQPVGCSFGGDSSNGSPFIGIGFGQQWYEAEGTSLAAPLAAGSLSRVEAAMGALLPPPHGLKALAAHFAERKSRHHEVSEVGYGRFLEDYGGTLNCPPNEVTVIYADSISRDQQVGYSLPLPDNLPSDMRIKIRWTLCYSSAVDPSEVLEYTNSALETVFRPHIQLFAFNDPNSHERIAVLNIATDSETALDLVAKGAQMSDQPVSFPGREIRVAESRRRDAGKWETIVSHRFSKKVSDLYLPRLDVSYLERRGGRLVLDGVAPHGFVLLVTLEADEGTNLYESVRQSFPVLTPVTLQIPLRT